MLPSWHEQWAHYGARHALGHKNAMCTILESKMCVTVLMETQACVEHVCTCPARDAHVCLKDAGHGLKRRERGKNPRRMRIQCTLHLHHGIVGDLPNALDGPKSLKIIRNGFTFDSLWPTQHHSQHTTHCQRYLFIASSADTRQSYTWGLCRRSI